MAVSSNDTLGCGRSIDQVWENVASPPDDHERGCPDCTAARDDLQPLRNATAELRRDDDDQQPGPQLLEHVMQVARSEVRRGRRIPMHRPGSWRHGDGLTVSEQAVAATVRRAALAYPEIQVRRCTARLSGGDDAEATPSEDGVPAEVALTLSISMAATTRLPELAARLRATVVETVEAEIGVRVGSIDLAVDDVHDMVMGEPDA